MAESKGWYGFDLDGTIAIYTVWQGPDHIGDPIPATIEIIKRLLNQGQRVKIFTARVWSGYGPEVIETATKTIKAWCLKNIGVELEVTSEKDGYLIEFYDDRCIPVEYNTGKLLDTQRYI